MPLPTPTMSMITSDSQLRNLLYSYLKQTFAEENFEFYFSTEGNRVKYQKYIRTGAPKEINITYDTRARLQQLAENGQWAQMNALMKVAKAEIGRLMSDDSLPKLQKTDEYSRWWVAKNKKLTDKGTKAFDLLKKNLGIGKKEADLKALMLIVEGGRTAADRKAAYEKVNKMLKLLVKAETLFRRAGLPVPK